MSKETANTVKGLVGVFKKDFGDEAVSYGGFFADEVRIPTGIFELDLALGGGLPRSRWTTIYGKESSNKTNIALKAIAHHQRIWPEQTNVFFDVEHSFDRKWAEKLGVDTDKLVVVEPLFAEKVIDMFEGFCGSDDIGMMVVDSLAAMVTTQEGETDATNNRVGGSSLIIGKFCRKAIYAIAAANRRGVFPTLVCINQLRDSMNAQKYAEKTKMSGGKAPLFAAGLIMQTYAKNIMDPKVSKALPCAKTTQVTIKKNKMPILALNCKFDFTLIPRGDLGVGDADDWNTIQTYLTRLDQFAKKPKGNGYIMFEEEYPTIAAARDRLYGDKEFGAEVRKAIIEALRTDDAAIESSDDTSTIDTD